LGTHKEKVKKGTHKEKVKKGTYKENMEVDKTKTNIMFIREGMEAMIVTGSRNVIEHLLTMSTINHLLI
jgi:hypothetical protein